MGAVGACIVFRIIASHRGIANDSAYVCIHIIASHHHGIRPPLMHAIRRVAVKTFKPDNVISCAFYRQEACG